MTQIKFGTDGWRAIIAKEYTVDNVRRIAEGTAKWLKSKGWDKVVIGHDCRFGGAMFAITTAQVMGALGIKVNLAKGFVSTPMISLGVLKTKSDLGIVITASHNPPSYNGFKLKSHYGGPTIPSDIENIEKLIPEVPTVELPSLEEMLEEGLLNYVDLEYIYINHIKENFDLEEIGQAGIHLAYDAMYGAGQNVMKALFPDAVFLHCENNPSFGGQAPEPSAKNLQELSILVKNNDNIKIGIANDGDADRIGLIDEKGTFIDAHDTLLILLHYLHEYKKMKGKVVVSFSVSGKLKKMSNLYKLPYAVTKIGFKHIAAIMTQEDVLVGGEESGGLTVKGHIPERDGVWIALVILEFMAKTGKSLRELVQEVHRIVGAFAYERADLSLPEEEKQVIVKRCKLNPPQKFHSYNVQEVEVLDGYKFHFDEERWVLVRPSGTEPLLRIYAQAPTQQECRKILEVVQTALRE